MSKIRYKDGYKYQLADTYICEVSIFPTIDVKTDYINLSTDGVLTIKKGYAWDGPSGPTIDTKNFMRGSLVHDALYQLMRMQRITFNWREQADLELHRICREDGMSTIRAWWVLKGVRVGGRNGAMPGNTKKVITAP